MRSVVNEPLPCASVTAPPRRILPMGAAAAGPRRVCVPTGYKCDNAGHPAVLGMAQERDLQEDEAMRTATRITLVLTGTAIMVAATATSGARADRGRTDDNRIRTTSAEQRARPQQMPGRLDYALARRTVNVATAVDHISGAPAVANFDRGETWASNQLASASKSDRLKKTSADLRTSCHRDTFASQQLNASDGGRGRIVLSEGSIACPSDATPKPRSRQVLLDEPLDLHVRTSEPAPALISFEAVIRINLATLAW
jgi:hypothetical protein